MCYLILFDQRYEYSTRERSSFTAGPKKIVLLEDTQFTTPNARFFEFPGPFKRWRITVNGKVTKEYFLAEEAIHSWNGYLSYYHQHGKETKKLVFVEWWEGFSYHSRIDDKEE